VKIENESVVNKIERAKRTNSEGDVSDEEEGNVGERTRVIGGVSLWPYILFLSRSRA
jgi:hypothetical protein